MTDERVAEEPRRTIIANCKRLLQDAHLLLAEGSAGSALSLAILAFEEVGRGHHHEFEIDKAANKRSWHKFRQVLAAFMLTASLCRKYMLRSSALSPTVRAIVEDRWIYPRTLIGLADEVVIEELYVELRSAVKEALRELDEDERIIGIIELRWAANIITMAVRELIEDVRHQGLYVDVKGMAVISDPENVNRQNAEYWISVAERALLLLECGDYLAPYGKVAAILEGLPKPLPKGEALQDLLAELRGRGAAYTDEFTADDTYYP